MCGIVGIFGQIGQTEKRIFRTLHLLDIIRGNDASGIIRVATDNTTSFIKAPGLPSNLLSFDDYSEENNPEYSRFFNYKTGLVAGNAKALIGHNRKATVGGTKVEAAHPFDFPNVIGVHNGTIAHHVYSKMEHYIPSANDSEALYFEIDKYGVEATYSKYEGAFACAAWNKTTNNLMLWRNAQRPMTIKFRSDKRTMAFASEPWMMAEAIEMERDAVGAWDTEHFEVPVNKLFNVFLGEDHTIQWDKVDLKPPAFVSTTFHNRTHWKETTALVTTTTPPEKEVVSGFASRDLTPNLKYVSPPNKKDFTCWWFNPKDQKFHQLDHYTNTRDKIEGDVWYEVLTQTDSTIIHRYYTRNEKDLKVVDLFKDMGDDGEDVPDEHFLKTMFKGGVIGNLPRDHWLKVSFDKENRPIFFPPEAGGRAYLINDKLGKYVFYADGNLWLTTAYQINSPKKEEEKESERVFSGPFGELFNEDEYEELLGNTQGCSCCGSYPSPDEYHTVKWSTRLREPTFTCESCSETLGHIAYYH